MQNIFSITAPNASWANIGALLEGDAVPLVGTNYVFKPCLFINKGASEVVIRSNGSKDTAPSGATGLTIAVAGAAKDSFEFPLFDARTSWIRGLTGTSVVEIVAYPPA